MVDETRTTYEEYYDIKKYKDEIAQFVTKKKLDLDVTSSLESNYEALRDIIFAGTTSSDTERYPHAAEMFKIYKSAIISSSLSGYSALVDVNGQDAYSVLKEPALKKVMTEQFKSMSLLEKLSGDTVDDWLLKGEAVSFIKLRENKENYRIKQTVIDAETGEPVMKFTMKEVASYDEIDIERIDPLDFYVDANDYAKDPRGCTKIIRTWVSPKDLLSSNTYPMLSKEDKDAIINSVGRNGTGNWFAGWSGARSSSSVDRSQTDTNKIEVLTFYGDYITCDNKVLTNIKAVVVNKRIADLKYSGVSTNRIIYAAYKVDENTHRGFSPLSSVKPVNKVVNRVTDMFLANLQDICDPIMLTQKGSLSFQQSQEGRKKRFLEYNSIEAKPEFWTPPAAAMQGLQLIQMILEQNKNTLGVNQYLAGSTDGAVRTAAESSILFQNANARMRVETDVFSYNYMLNLFTAFYGFNRELAFALDRPLDPIYSDEQMKMSISTNASRADKQGELQRLMQMLNLPIAQMIFSNLQPDQVVLAVRYLMAKAELNDADNLLELVNPNTGEANTVVSDEVVEQQGPTLDSLISDMNNIEGVQ